MFMVHNLFSKVTLYDGNYLFIRQYSIKNAYRLLFFGSNEIGLKSLHKVNCYRKSVNTIERLDLVVASTAKNKSDLEKYAQKEHIKTIPWPLNNLHSSEYDLGLIVAFGHLIKADVLNKFPLGMINVHPSLLPRWRGAAPIIHTLLNGDEITGVSLMKIKADIFDVGEIINQERLKISNDIKLPELTEKLSEIGAEMLVECIKRLPDSLASAQPQSEDGVTYAKKINKNISEVRWSDMTAREVYNLYRAIYGLYPLSTKFRHKPLKLFDSFLKTDAPVENKPVGSLEYCAETNAIKILCKDKKYIYFKKLRIVGKKEITALDFYNGYIKNEPPEKRCIIVGN